jgi:S-adenosylmethionine hydrolase
MARPIAILTDYGYSDAYAGILRGVILSRCPDARIIDLTHGVPPRDVLAGAMQLAAAIPYCPPDTIFLAVVDPGVGSERRPIAVRSTSRLFVGPDNGLLWPAAAAAQVPDVFHLNRPQYWLSPVSATFHGRDVFAPIAAMLALGREIEDFGRQVLDAQRLYLPKPAPHPDGILGEVLYVDQFGNAVTNLRPEDVGSPAEYAATFRVGGWDIPGPATHYGAAEEGQPVIVLGSMGYYEVAVNGGSAAAALQLARKSSVLTLTAS